MAARDRSAPPCPRQGRLRGEAGFTLIEVLIALFVLAVGILGATKLIASSEASTLDSELQQIATEEAEQAIEDVRVLDYAEIGHGSAGLPNQGQPYQAPDAATAEDIVALSSGTGVVPSRTFEVARGGDKPPVTGTIETFITWRDEECSPLDLANLPRIVTLRSRLTALQAQIAPLVGASGLLSTTGRDLSDKMIEAIPSGQRPDYVTLRAEVNALLPLLETTSTQAARVRAMLDNLPNIDLCDLEPADLSGLKALLAVSPTQLANLTSALGPVNSTLTDLSGPLATLAGYIADPSLGTLTCGLLPTPNICGTVSSLVGPAVKAILPTSGTATWPKTIAPNVNSALSAIDFDGAALNKDTTHNTKRITVAVTVDTGRDDITPNNTIWLSSVVTDPDAGLIINGGL